MIMKSSVKITSNGSVIIHDYENNLEFSIGECRRVAGPRGFPPDSGKIIIAVEVAAAVVNLSPLSTRTGEPPEHIAIGYGVGSGYV